MGLLDRLRHELFGQLGRDAQALVDTAVMAMRASRPVLDVEIETALRLLLRMPWFQGVDSNEMRGHLERAIARGKKSDMRTLARAFRDEPDAREVQLGISAYVLMADRAMEASERAWLDELARLLDVEEARIEELLADIAEHMRLRERGEL